jgi:ABC-type nickel/cobalt efflux system permease component RcnA
VQQNKFWVSVLSIVLIGVVALFVISRATHERRIEQAQAASNQYASTFHIDTKGLAVPTSTNFVYRVVGPPGATATIDYSKQSGEHDVVSHVKLPWSISLPAQVSAKQSPSYGLSPYVEAQTDTHGAKTQVTCQAFADGKLNDQETNSGPYVTVSCGFPF